MLPLRPSVVYLRVASFLAVGSIATGIQYAVLIILVRYFDFHPVWASTIGYIGSAVVNYYLNYTVTFKSKTSHAEAFSKFIVVAGAGLICNALLMAIFTNGTEMPYLVAQIVTTAIVLVGNYLASYLWTFK